MLSLLLILLCGSERWPIKTLADKAALQVILTPKPTTISEINSWPAACMKSNLPRQPQESQIYQLRGIVSLIKHEADGDIHIVLNDGGEHMIVESPSLACAEPSHYRLYLKRTRLVAQTLKVGDYVEVEGPAFADYDHGQAGKSRSCYELHPLIRIEKIPYPQGSVTGNAK